MQRLLVLALVASAAALRVRDAQLGVDPQKCPGAGGGHAEVPAQLWDLGVKLLGSKEKLTALAAATHPPCSIKIGGFDVQFVMPADDEWGVKGLEKEHGEGGGDVYGMRRMSETGVMVDIGANIGDTAILAAKLRPKMQVIAFEPVPPTYFYMLWNMHLNNVAPLSAEDLGKPGKAGVLALNEVVGDGHTDMKVKWPEPSEGSLTWSATTHDKFRGNFSNEKMVHSEDLPKLLKQHDVTSVDFLKLDCEGCEYFVVPMLHDLVADKDKLKHLALEAHPGIIEGTNDGPMRKEAVAKVVAERGCGGAQKEGTAGDVLLC